MSVDQAPAVTEQGRREAEALRLLRDGYSISQAHDKTGIPADRIRQLALEQPGRPARPAPPAGACGHVTELPTRLLTKHPGNVRTDLGDLTELQQSILAQGILQPLLVTRGERGQYVVIGGHRRLAAAVAVDLPRVPVMVRERLDGSRATEAMLVENLQRADLHPLDEAAAYQRLIGEGRSRAQIAAAVGKDPGHLSQRLALLNLTPAEQAALRRGEITLSEGYHAGRSRSPNAFPAGQRRPKPRRVPHFVVTHPQAEDAGSRCEHETTLKLGVACGPCWEASIREDERDRLGGGRRRAEHEDEPQADPPPSPARQVDEVAVMRACDGDQTVQLNIGERREAVRTLHRRGLSDGAIAERLGLTPRSVLRIRQSFDLPANSAGAA